MLRRFLPALALAWGGAQLCIWLDTPLPWMIGSLCATAAACMLGAPLAAPVQAREAGQWVIGTTLGLYFSRPVLDVLRMNWAWITLAAACALVLGWLGGVLLRRLSGADRATAFFAMSIGGAAEMAVQAERHGARVDRVAAAHSLRILLVVCLIPAVLRAIHGASVHAGPVVAPIHAGGLLALMALTAALSLFLKRRRVPNAWVIGSLLVAAALTASGVALSSMPEWMIRVAQVCIGVSLGTRFTPGFLRTAPRYLGAVAFCALATMAVAAAFGGCIAVLSGIAAGTMILATAPGGIAEMALTARMLDLGVPVVTAFHVTRMLIVVLAVGPLFRFSAWMSGTGEDAA